MDLLSVRSVALVIFVGLLVALGPPQVLAATKADMYNLHDDLFTTRGYKKQVRPIEFDSNSLFVYMAFSLLSLVDVSRAVALPSLINIELYSMSRFIINLTHCLAIQDFDRL